jgi:hypothetical protein
MSGWSRGKRIRRTLLNVRLAVVLASVLTWVALTGCTAQQHVPRAVEVAGRQPQASGPVLIPTGTPVRATSTPVPRRVNGVCANDEPRPTSAAHGVVTVDADPTGLVSTWLPGLNSRACIAVTVSSDHAVAAARANDIRQAQRPRQLPKGSPPIAGSCPMDDGGAVQLVFTYKSRAPEVVYVELWGCEDVTAPGRYPREFPRAVHLALGSIAPAAFRSYFDQ